MYIDILSLLGMDNLQINTLGDVIVVIIGSAVLLGIISAVIGLIGCIVRGVITLTGER